VEITFPSLATLNNAVSLSYNTQFYIAERRCDPFTFDATSTGDAEVYPRLDLIGGLREWLGERAVERLSITTFSIPNKWFEKTIGVSAENIQDDKYGFLSQASMQLGQNAAHFRDLQIAALLANGASSANGYDGVPFFSTAHPNYTSSGSTTGPNTTVANYQSGSGNPRWYLIDTTKVIKPLIWQTRKPFQIIPKFSMTDEQVFWNKEFEWGVDGRCNAGYGLWQFAAMCMGPLNATNIIQMRTNMASIRRPSGVPMGLRAELMVVPSSLLPNAKQYAENEFLPAGDALITSGQPTVNPVRNLFTVLEDEWLN
jgi:phage major head subunit gpT-like protein